MGKKTTAGIVAATLLLGAAYITADALDVVPGVLTTRPVVPEPEPRPEITVEALTPEPSITAFPSSTTEISPAVDSFMSDERMGELRAVTVLDGATGQVLDQRNSSTPMPPASSTKVLTAAAALTTLGAQTRLATTATLDGDQVTLVGGGDILLTTGEPEPGSVLAASLTDLASQTARALDEAGVSSVSLALDDSLIEQRGYADTWSEIDHPWVMPISSLAVDTGLIGERTYDDDPALGAALTFAQELRAQGIDVREEPVRARSPEGAVTVGVIRSAPVEQIVRYMMKVSDNSVTELMGMLTAIERGLPSTFAGSTQAVADALTDLGLPTESLVLRDVCGLSSFNEVTSDLLAHTVLLALSEPELTSLISAFPVMHLDGTLASRGDGAAGLVRAKTGTLTHVVSLTGIAHADDGALLVFSAVASETSNNWEARAGIDEFAERLRSAQ